MSRLMMPPLSTMIPPLACRMVGLPGSNPRWACACHYAACVAKSRLRKCGVCVCVDWYVTH